MTVDRVKFQEIVSSQLPRYVREDFPLLTDFLEQYYISQEYESGPVDLINNIDQYVKVENLTNLTTNTKLAEDVDYTETDITVVSTEGFSETNGIIQINNEIIHYATKTATVFEDCSRGFSGITTYVTTGQPDTLTFSETVSQPHSTGATVKNLNVLFLQQFFKKIKHQFTPGFTERNLYKGLNEQNFIYGADSFYTSKGTNQSYEILFRALYGEDVEIIRPSQFLLTPSNANYKVTKDFVVEKLQGDPLNLQNLTIFQQGTNARGSITNVQQIPYDDYQFYQISIDTGYNRSSDVEGSIFGEFRPNPRTQVLNNISVGATIIDVDSTIDFPEFGKLAILNQTGEEVSIAYSGRTANQFFNVSGVLEPLLKKEVIQLDAYSYAYVGITTEEEIQVRFTSTLKDFIQDEPTAYFRPTDTIQIKSMGYEAPGKKNNNYILNVKSKYRIEKTTVIDAKAGSYQFRVFDDTFFKEGYAVRYENEDSSVSILGTITRTVLPNTVNVTFNTQIPLKGEYYLENQLLKGSSLEQPYVENFVANVQNTYAKYDGSTLIASNSIPKYYNLQTNAYDKSITFSASLLSTQDLVLPTNPTTLPDTGFFTGDSVWFQSAGNGFQDIPSGAYFVFRVDESTIKLSKSKADLSKGIYLTFNGSVVDASITLLDFYSKNVEPQGLYRKILEPVTRKETIVTDSGYTGMFINGLELLNYKSANSVYYGDIVDFTMTAGGFGYDVINPPVVTIKDEVGVGASGKANIIGQLVALDVVDTGMGYEEIPTITISGGNGFGAAAQPRMLSVKLENSFIADFTEDVNLARNEITFDEDHRFQDGESVIYQPRNTKAIAGLTTDAEYFVFVTGQKSMTLHETRADSFAGISTIQMTALGDGVQYFVASELKQVVSSVVITNPGVGYENKERTVPPVGVNTVSNYVQIVDHGYLSKEVVKYTKPETGASIVGLSERKSYFVKKINDNEFGLTEIGTAEVGRDYYYNNDILIDFVNAGRGSFNYPPITVDVQGAAASFDKTFVETFQELYIIESPIEENIITPIATLAWTDTEAEITNNGSVANQFFVMVSEEGNWLISDDPFIGNILLYEAVLQPIFRGAVQSINLTDGGVGYGSSTIIDFRRQPEVTFTAGGVIPREEAKLTPIINNGQISEVIVNAAGKGYNSPPDLQILSETGQFAVLVVQVENGGISKVIVRKGGAGYEAGKTSVIVTPAGQGARTQANVRAWNVNLFAKNYENIGDSDTIVSENISNENLQYSALYAPRPLRKTVFTLSGFEEDNVNFGIFDLTLDSGGEEEVNTFHSPIVGWAYDGNPIYGPYGFKNVDGSGGITRMLSGYKLKATPINRPSYNAFSNGFFVDDYIFTGDGNLDVSNGRFCVTPDYPNGVYAYFCTIADNIESSGPFNKFRQPVFPYVIGNQYHSLPEAFNFKSASNQLQYDIAKDGWLRNTTFYYTNKGNSQYDYIYNSDLIRNQSIDVTGAQSGGVDNIIIEDGGEDYNVNDRVIFDSTGTSGRNINYRVSNIKGKPVNTVSLASTFINDVEFGSNLNVNGFVGYTSAPHNFLPRELINIDALSEYYKGFDGAYTIGVSSERWTLSVGVGTDTQTGIQTYIYVTGSLDSQFIRSNDILKCEREQMKVLNIDPPSGRIRVLRGVNNTFAVTHPAGTLLRDDPRKLNFTVLGITTQKALPINKTIYFEPNESVGIGTSTTSGITTLTFSNPGVGVTQVRVEKQQIFLPDHQLILNTPLKYYTNGGTSLQAFSGIQSSSIYDLTETRDLFAVPLSKNIIGIASQPVGMGTQGRYVGISSDKGTLLFFENNVGLGSYHSFVSDITKTLSGRVSQNIVTVSTGETHGMKKGDIVDVDVNPTTTTTIRVLYNDFNRRIVFDPDVIPQSGINTNSNIFTVPVNKYNTGDKIIYTADTVSEGLIRETMYYVYVYKPGQIKLVRDYSELLSENPSFINVGSAQTSTFSRINPPVTIQKNQNIRFDLSDSSLSFTDKGVDYSAFEMFIYKDFQKVNKFWTTGTTRNFEVTTSGTIGVTNDAALNIFVSDTIPSTLYYGFVPDNLDIIPPVKLRIYEDTTLLNYNTLSLIDNKFDGIFSIIGFTSTTFDYNIAYDDDQVVSYGTTNANLSYKTNSRTAIGEVCGLTALNQGVGYKSLPGYRGIESKQGTGALLKPTSKTIGKILQTRFNNIGFGYPSDNTLNINANLPQVLEVEPLGSFGEIGITSAGVRYSQAPELIVLDGLTGLQITDVELFYELGDQFVTIEENTNSLNNVPPSIIPVQNTNGFSISSITYNETSKIVRLEFGNQFSFARDWPFKVGEKVLVENVAIGFGTDGKGYNSEDYGYALFPVTGADSQLGGSGAYIEYDLSEYLTAGESPGRVTTQVVGSVTPTKFFPVFDATIVTVPFLTGEDVEIIDNPLFKGTVERFDSVSRFLFVTSEDDFEVGSILRSLTSGNQGKILTTTDYKATIAIGVGATFIYGWQSNSGFLNDNLQVIPNNEYYQNFSYSLKSRVPYETWNDPVSSLNHTAGFEKFADLVIDNNAAGIVTAIEAEISTVVDLIGEVETWCYPDFDAATESTVDISGGKVVSNEIIFENRILLDYFESIGNRVLSIDDFSDQFDSNPRTTEYSIVDFFDNKYSWNKIFTLVQDTQIQNRKQFEIVDLVQDGENGYVNEYGRIDTGKELGTFGYIGAGTSSWGLTFFPTLFEYNNYQISYFTFSGLNNVTGIGSTTLGDIVSIATTSANVSVATTTTLATIPTTIRSSKLLIQLEDANNNYFFNELNLLHDGTRVESLQYGDLDNNPGIAAGFGTYHAYIDGSDLKVDIIPTVGTAVTANCSIVEIAGGGASGVSTTNLVVTNLSSYNVDIAASGSPTANLVANYENPFACEYFIVQVTDSTNNEYEMFECAVIDSTNEGIVKFADIKTNVGLGTVGVTKTGSTTNLVYTPNASIDVNVRAFGISLKNFNDIAGISSITLGNNVLFSEFGTYTGTELDTKKAFRLFNNTNPIFAREFAGNSPLVVDLTENHVNIPNHFFVTGEKIEYSYENSALSTGNAIGIATTAIAGVSTDKLPSTLFAVKINDVKVGVAQSAADALVSPPVLLDLTTLGIGTFHKFTCTNQNARALVAIDNMIQAPITETQNNTTLTQDIVFDVDFSVAGVSSFKANDLIKINQEVMLIQNVGVGTPDNLRVLRAQMGTGIGTHANGTSVELIGGNYNIVDNTIHFVEAPYGKTPLSTTTGAPDERYWGPGVTTYSSFQGRTFMRSGIPDGELDTYATNFTFDNIQLQFNGQTKNFTLLNNGANVTGFSTQQAIVLNSNILQEPQGAQASLGDFTLTETAGITSIRYLGDSVSSLDDPNKATIPRGGNIISVASTPGLGYQPLISAGGSVTVSVAGTILSFTQGNTGSGYRTGIQTNLQVGYAVSTVGLTTVVGFATATFVNGSVTSIEQYSDGSNLNPQSPPLIVFDKPIPYSSIPLVYADGQSGVGTGAQADIVVGQGSSVIAFNIVRGGFGYQEGEIVRPAIGGTTGILTGATYDGNDFELTITGVYRDTFNGFTVGELDVFDSIASQFDGQERVFNLQIAGQNFAIEVADGSPIVLSQCLIVTINDVLQIPTEAYKFTGGGVIEFSEPPSKGDSCKIIFYKGTPDIDVILVDVLETVKEGDTLTLNNDSSKGQSFGFQQEPRVVTGITTLDTVSTFPYDGPGLTTNRLLVRPVTWCKQQDDIVIDGKFVTKDRPEYSPFIQPTAYLISYVGTSSQFAYTDTARPFFMSTNETNLIDYQYRINIIDQTTIVGATATTGIGTVGAATTTVTVITPGQVGSGYSTFTPTVSISAPNDPNGIRATATANVSGSGVTSYTITNAGTGYTMAPQIQIEVPEARVENIGVNSYFGDQGQIVGYAQSTGGLGTLELYIPEDSYMRDPAIVGTAVTVSQLKKGDWFTVDLSHSKTVNNFDGIYQVAEAYTVVKDAAAVGVGTTALRRIEVNNVAFGATGSGGVYNNETIYGFFSWGKVQFLNRLAKTALEFTPNPYTGITTSPLIQRQRPLKNSDYVT